MTANLLYEVSVSGHPNLQRKGVHRPKSISTEGKKNFPLGRPWKSGSLHLEREETRGWRRTFLFSLGDWNRGNVPWGDKRTNRMNHLEWWCRKIFYQCKKRICVWGHRRRTVDGQFNGTRDTNTEFRVEGVFILPLFFRTQWEPFSEFTLVCTFMHRNVEHLPFTERKRRDGRNLPSWFRIKRNSGSSGPCPEPFPV